MSPAAQYRPELYGTIDAFRESPERFWGFWLELVRVCAGAAPNPAHRALAELEKRGRLAAVITQNVDGLHAAAGSKEVIELHGTPDALVCLECNAHRKQRMAELREPPRCECGAIMKPDVVLFGEMLPFFALSRAEELAEKCDVCLVIGTSAQVYPAAAIPETAFKRGATVVEVNLERTRLSESGRAHHFLGGPSGTTLPRLIEIVLGG